MHAPPLSSERERVCVYVLTTGNTLCKNEHFASGGGLAVSISSTTIYTSY